MIKILSYNKNKLLKLEFDGIQLTGHFLSLGDAQR